MKTKLLILFLLISTFAAGQSIVPLKGDSVVISKTGSSAELVVRNRTKDSLNGVMVNTGNGVVQFKRIRAINDSQFVVGGDTIKIKGVPTLSFSTIPVGATPTAVYQSGTTLIARAFGDSTFNSWTVNGAGKLVNVWDTAALRSWILTFATEDDGLPTMTFTDGGVGVPFLNLYDDTTAVIKDVKDSIFTKWVSHPLYNVSYDDTAAMRSWILTFALASSDTSNLLFDTIPGGTSLPTAIFQVGDSILRTRGFGDSVFTKFSINGAGVLVGRTDTAAMRTWILTFASGGGGGGADANAWHVGGDAWAAYKTIGNTSNFGIGFLTNNALRGRVDSNGVWVWAGGTPVSTYKEAHGDTAYFTAMRFGSASRTTGTAGGNALLSLYSSGSASTQSILSIFSGLNNNPIFNVSEAGLLSAPAIWGSLASTAMTFAGTTVTIRATNIGGTSGSLTSISSGTTSSVGASNTRVLGIAGTYTASGGSNTGIYSAIEIVTAMTQSGQTNPTAGLTINVNGTGLTDYKAIRIVDGGQIYTNGSLFLNTAGGKISIKSGSNASIGRSTLSAGSVTVSTTAVTANSKIFITRAVTSGTEGHLRIGTVTAGTSFIIESSSASETSQIDWLIIDTP